MATRRRHRGDGKRHDDHDKDDRHRKPKRHKKKRHPAGPGTASIKADTRSVVTGRNPTAGTPEQNPQDYPDDQGVFSTGPGQAVEYHYHRAGTYADDYAAQENLARFETQERAPNISGPGEVVTSGAANNPT